MSHESSPGPQYSSHRNFYFLNKRAAVLLGERDSPKLAVLLNFKGRYILLGKIVILGV